MNIQKFTQKSLEAIQNAQTLAIENQNAQVEQEHLLLALLEQENSLIKELIKKIGDEESIENEIRNKIENKPKMTGGARPSDGIYVAQDVDKVLADSESIAKKMKDEYVSVEHIMLAIFNNANSNIKEIFRRYSISKNEFLKALSAVRGNTRVTSDNPEDTYDVLKKYGQDLTQMAREQKLDPVIGRDTEIRNVIRILSRKTKNNPCLIGEPGVGKTAIAEGLAQRIVTGNVPEILRNKRIISLSIGSMLAGAKYRGEFEERLKKAIDEVQQHDDMIIFIDEIHTLVGAGATEGAMDAANILKPALARGEFQVIGATTLDEYKKHIEKDAALERRFQPVQVGEPNEEDALEILKGLRDRYEAFHKAKITDEALKAAVTLSSRYITDRFLPDKAIDVVDEAASKVRMKVFSAAPDVKALEDRLNTVKKEKEAAVTSQAFEKAAKLRDEEQSLVKEIDDKKSVAKEESEQKLVVTEDDIAAVVAQWTGIPVAKIADEESQTLLHLEEELHKRVVGQDDAVTAVAKAVRRARAGLKDPKRPIGSFLFLGPTGVGKTELARALASSLFGDESAMIRLDMSEYMEKHTVSRLVGAPPGYVGYEEGGQLTDAVRRKPYSVILLDEVEKAHADFFNILLQVLDDGRLTDSQGRTVDFRNTVIIMTSNLGAKALHKNSSELGFLAPKKSESSTNQSNSIDFKEAKKSVMDAVKRHFRPEFLNRIDEMIVFRPLTEEDLKHIVSILMSDVTKRLKERELQLEITSEAMQLLVKEGSDFTMGARPLKRAIQRLIEDPVSDLILKGDVTEGKTIKVDVKDNEIVVSV